MTASNILPQNVLSDESPRPSITVQEIPDGEYIGYRLNEGNTRFDICLTTCEIIGVYANSADEAQEWFGELFGSFLPEGASQWQPHPKFDTAKMTDVIEYNSFFVYTIGGIRDSISKSELTGEQETELRQLARQLRPTPRKTSKKTTKRSTSTRTPRGWTASQVLSRGYAMVELVERTNEKEAA